MLPRFILGCFMYKLFMVSDDYINFCYSYDHKVQMNKEEDREFPKKYLGIIYFNNGFKYYIPLSSYKPKKHDTMDEKIDFIRIEDDKGKYAVLNINNMLPIPDEAIINFDLNFLPNNTEKERKYRDLLRNEWDVCVLKKDKIISSANKIYSMVEAGKPINIVDRCCKFKLHESNIPIYLNKIQILQAQEEASGTQE